jgi:hypothetical protein
MKNVKQIIEKQNTVDERKHKEYMISSPSHDVYPLKAQKKS